MFTEYIDDLYKKKNDIFAFINQYSKFFGKDTLINFSKLLYEDHCAKEISYMDHSIIGPYFNNQECRLYAEYNMGQIYMSFSVPYAETKTITANAQDIINTLRYYINNKYIYDTKSMMDPLRNRVKQIINQLEERAKEEFYKFLQHYFDGEEFYSGSTCIYRYSFGIHLGFMVEYLCSINSIPQFRIFISENQYDYSLFQSPYPMNVSGCCDPMRFYGSLPNNEIKSITLSIVDLYEMIYNNTNSEMEEENKKEEEKEEYRDLSDSIHKKRMELKKDKEEHEKITIRNKARLLDFLLYANKKEPLKEINDRIEKKDNCIEIPIVSREIKYTIYFSREIRYTVYTSNQEYVDRHYGYYVSAYETDKQDNSTVFGFYMKTEDINDIFQIILSTNRVTEYYFITLAEQLFDAIKRNPSITDNEFFNTLKSALYQEKEQTLDIIDGLKLDIVTGKFINSSKQLTLYYSIGFYTTILRTFAINKRELDKILDLIYYMHFTDEE